MHLKTTRHAPPGSSTLRYFDTANHNAMFSNRIGFGPRLGATLLDFVFTILLCAPIGLFGAGAGIATALGLDSMLGSDEAEAMTLIGLSAGVIGTILVCSLLGLAYTLVEALTGASPGKRVLGLKVAKADGKAGDEGTSDGGVPACWLCGRVALRALRRLCRGSRGVGGGIQGRV